MVCLAAGLVMPYISCNSCHESLSRYLIVGFFTSLIWITMWLGNDYISCELDNRFDWTKEPIRRLVAGLLSVAGYTVLMTLLLIWFFRSAFDLQFGSAAVTVYSTTTITFIITFFMTSRSFLTNWRQTAIDAERLQRETITARYENLKSQVNPHFLFNSLNTLTNLVYEDADKSARFIKQLSEVYRYVLDTREVEAVSLEEELKFLTSYIYLQQIRFGKKLAIDLQLNGSSCMVAPLSLQMLVENAIKHNITSEENPLQVSLYEDEEYLIIENDLQRKHMLDNTPGLGLDNIKKRYEYLTDKAVIIEEGADKFKVKLPKLKVR